MTPPVAANQHHFGKIVSPQIFSQAKAIESEALWVYEVQERG